MTHPSIVPCLWFDDQAEAAAACYVAAFPAGAVVATSRFPTDADNPAQRPRGSVLTVEFTLAGARFTALNGGPVFTPNPSVSFFVHCDEAAEVDRLAAALGDGGSALMPVGSYPWSERYGWIRDRWGVTWQLMAGRRSPGGPTIAPCLMFTGAQHGRAEAAMQAYTAAFPGGRIDLLDRYVEGEPAPGTVKHARFRLGDHELVAMDAPGEHAFQFDEGLSLQVMCADQAEVDHYWDALGAGGSHGPCGWLKDRFGLSWQVVPAAMASWMASPDAAARDRAFAAVMSMTKLDVATIERAFRGA